jgi:protocatechuate 3,4-dioxygenase beta subunit
VKRRDFLKWSGALSGGAMLSWTGCDGAPAGGPDGSLGWDGAAGADAAGAGGDGAAADAASGACAPTEADALGPFFEAGAPMRAMIADDTEPGERLALACTVVDPECAPIAGVLVDIWQADRAGVYHDAGIEYRLRGQVTTDPDGRFAIDTIVPGNYTIAPGVWRPAHLHFMLARPGFTTVATQIYFAGDPYLQPNDGCGTCGSDDPERIVTLSGSAKAGWQGEVRLALARA